MPMKLIAKDTDTIDITFLLLYYNEHWSLGLVPWWWSHVCCCQDDTAKDEDMHVGVASRIEENFVKCTATADRQPAMDLIAVSVKTLGVISLSETNW